MSEVFAGQRLERELLLPAALPQEIRVHRLGELVRLVHEVGEAGAVEAEQHGGGLYLGALAVRRLDLQRGIVVGEHGADLEAAFLFVKDVLAHGSISGAMNRRREGG